MLGFFPQRSEKGPPGGIQDARRQPGRLHSPEQCTLQPTARMVSAYLIPQFTKIYQEVLSPQFKLAGSSFPLHIKKKASLVNDE